MRADLPVRMLCSCCSPAILPEKTRKKPGCRRTCRTSVLKTWATNSPFSVGSMTTSVALSPVPLMPWRLTPLTGEGAYSVMASSSSATPMSLSFLAAVQKMGMMVPAARAPGNAAANCSVEISPSLRYFSISASSLSTMASMSCERCLAKSTRQPAGGGLGGFSTLSDAAELRAQADRGVEQDAGLAEGVADVLQQIVEVDVVAVEPIDDDHARQAAPGRFVEHAAGVDLQAGLGGDDDDRRLHGGQRRQRLAEKSGLPGVSIR